MKLGKYWRLGEFESSVIADMRGIDNSAPADVVAMLRLLVFGVLDPLRESWGTAIEATSGYRCPELNGIVKGHPRSDHMFGRAVDLKPHQGTSVELLAAAQALNLPIYRAILYAPGRGGHVHISIRPGVLLGRAPLFQPEDGDLERLGA